MKAKITRVAGTIELEGSVEDVAAAIKALEMPAVSVPSVWGPTAGYSWDAVRFISPSVPCQHEWPNVWMSVSPPSCIKCGARAYQAAPNGHAVSPFVTGQQS